MRRYGMEAGRRRRSLRLKTASKVLLQRDNGGKGELFFQMKLSPSPMLHLFFFFFLQYKSNLPLIFFVITLSVNSI